MDSQATTKTEDVEMIDFVAERKLLLAVKTLLTGQKQEIVEKVVAKIHGELFEPNVRGRPPTKNKADRDVKSLSVFYVSESQKLNGVRLAQFLSIIASIFWIVSSYPLETMTCRQHIGTWGAIGVLVAAGGSVYFPHLLIFLEKYVSWLPCRSKSKSSTNPTENVSNPPRLVSANPAHSTVEVRETML